MEKKGIDKKLFNEFLKVDENTWYKQAQKEIGRKELLYTETYEKIPISPIYFKKDIKGLYSESIFQHNNRREWLYIEEVSVANESEANIAALNALEGGADGICFSLQKDSIDVDKLMNGIWLDNCLVVFNVKDSHVKFIDTFLNYYIAKYNNKETLKGWICYSFIPNPSEMGSQRETQLDTLLQYFSLTNSFSGFTSIVIDNAHLSNMGSDINKEIAYTLSLAVDIVENFMKAGYTAERTMSKLLFSLTVGMNFFFEISKIRAFRNLWSKIAEKYDFVIIPEKIQIHAKTSRWYKSLADQENNIIRNASEAMASILGGVDYLTINNPFGESITGKRISRNISHILKDEVFLSRVVDPSAGSFYIESLTNSIALESWKLFLEIEKEGGFIHSLINSDLVQKIEHLKEEKVKDIDLRKSLVIGSNIYSNHKEYLPEVFSEEAKESTFFLQRQSTHYIEHLRSIVEKTFRKSERAKAAILGFDRPIDKSISVFLKNVFSSVGFAVEVKSEIKNFITQTQKLGGKYELVIVYVDSESVGDLNKAVIEGLQVNQFTLFTSIGKLNLENDQKYYQLEEIAKHKNLEKIIEEIIKKTDEQA